LEHRYLNAAYHGDWETMMDLLKLVPPETTSTDQAVKLAVRGGQTEIVKNLVRKNLHNLTMYSLCTTAGTHGNLDIVRDVLSNSEAYTNRFHEMNRKRKRLVCKTARNAAAKGHLNILKWLSTITIFKKLLPTVIDSRLVGSNLLMVRAIWYDMDMIEWVLENVDLDIQAKNDLGDNVLVTTLEAYSKNIRKKPDRFLKLVELLVVVGKADPEPLWTFLLPFWEKDVSTLEIGEDQMLQDFIKVLYFQRRPSLVVEDALRATRHGHLVDEANELRIKVAERERGLGNLIGAHLPDVLQDIVRGFDEMTTDETWSMKTV
jgi:hypothetical protein